MFWSYSHYCCGPAFEALRWIFHRSMGRVGGRLELVSSRAFCAELHVPPIFRPSSHQISQLSLHDIMMPRRLPVLPSSSLESKAAPGQYGFWIIIITSISSCPVVCVDSRQKTQLRFVTRRVLIEDTNEIQGTARSRIGRHEHYITIWYALKAQKLFIVLQHGWNNVLRSNLCLELAHQLYRCATDVSVVIWWLLIHHAHRLLKW